MIRINLATAGAFMPASANQAAAEGEMAMLSRDELIKAVASRLFFVLLFPGLLYSYELFNLPKLRTVVDQKQSALAELVAKNEKAPQILEELKKIDASEQAVRTKLDLVEGMRKSQLAEVRGLDTIQRLLPPRVWLTTLELKDKHLKISGLAQLDSDLGSFIDALSKSLFFKEVSLIKSTEASDSKAGMSLKQFELSATLEAIK